MREGSISSESMELVAKCESQIEDALTDTVFDIVAAERKELEAEVERLRESIKTLAIRSESVCVCKELREAEAAEESNAPT
ncbi:MAG: hypothetical protein V3V96_10620 [Acidiferrobacterales bacterium]